MSGSERVTVVETEEEFAAVAHLRTWCHDTRVCPICRAYLAGESKATDEIASGT